jgi:hypothetical protein
LSLSAEHASADSTGLRFQTIVCERVERLSSDGLRDSCVGGVGLQECARLSQAQLNGLEANGKRGVYMKHQSTLSNIVKACLILMVVMLAAVDSKSQGSINNAGASNVMVIGFVGGLRSPEDKYQGVVQIRDRLRSLDCAGLTANSYNHFHWRKAYKNAFQEIDLDRNGSLSDAEIRQAPKIIIYGHSLGGWAVIKLARRFEKAHIPVELTAQIDTVGIGDEVAPGNVKFAVNYYQRTQWPIRGEKRIRPEMGSSTNVIDNVLIQRVGHEALARETQISDFITDKVRALCSNAKAPSNTIASRAPAVDDLPRGAER